MGGVRAGIMHGIVSGTMSWVVSEALIASQVGPGGERGGGVVLRGEGVVFVVLVPTITIIVICYTEYKAAEEQEHDAHEITCWKNSSSSW